MKNILLSIIFYFLFSSLSYAGACLTTIASASTNQLASRIINLSFLFLTK